MFLCLFVAYVVCPVRDFIFRLFLMYGAGPSALRRREFVRHVATSQPCIAYAWGCAKEMTKLVSYEEVSLWAVGSGHSIVRP
jgi:hypothetical protein